MATYFTGTATDKVYEVGKGYTMGGDVYRANADGSFTNTSSGQTLKGSAGNPNVSWYEGGGSTSSGSGLERIGGSLASGGSGPGSERVHTSGTPAQTSGPGSGGVTTGPDKVPGPGSQPLTIKTKDSGTGLMIGGDGWSANPWFSNADQWEERYGEPGDWIGGLVVGSADAVFNAGRFVDWAVGADTVSNKRPDTDVMSGMAKGPGALGSVIDAFERQDGLWSQQLHRAFGTGMVVPMGGF